MLFALGLDRQIVGRTGFCVHPRDEVRHVPKVGGTKTVKLEAIRALRATHVIVNIDENERDTVDRLRLFVPHIVVTHPQAPRDNLALYALLGAIFERGEAAQRLCAALEARLAEAEAAAQAWPAARVLYLIWRAPWMAVARDTYISAMLRLVNWHTMPDVQGGPTGAARYPPSTSTRLGWPRWSTCCCRASPIASPRPIATRSQAIRASPASVSR